jgi:cell division septal protein FtsQ
MLNRRSTARRPLGGARVSKPAALRPGARPGGGIRRTKPVKRASARVLTPVRAGAALAVLVAVGGLYGAMSSDLFVARTTEVTGATWTSEDAILAALALPDGQNVFTLGTAELERRLEAIPAVAGADVSVALPDRVQVSVAERVALVAWAVGGHRYLVDADGTLFGEMGEEIPAGSDVPIVTDRRFQSTALGIGSRLDPVSLDTALRLASLAPADIASGAEALSVRVDDTNGFVLHAEPLDWNAIFGFYTPTLRTTDLIPGQVRLLRSLILDNDEANVRRVILADERSGTFIPRRTPEPSGSPKP